MAFQIVLSDLASQDIDATVQFLTTRSPKAAREWFETIVSAIESLSSMPERAPIIPENNHFQKDYRHLIYKNHRIVFRVDEPQQQVIIVRVYNSRRAPLGNFDIP